jgi:hypothetical protein
VNLVIRPGRAGRGPLGLGEDLPMPVALRISFEFTGELRPYSFVRSVWTGYPFSVFIGMQDKQLYTSNILECSSTLSPEKHRPHDCTILTFRSIHLANALPEHRSAMPL